MMTPAQVAALERLAHSGLTNEQYVTRYKQATYFVLPTVEELARDKKSFSVLEVGCGEGPKAGALASVATEYMGIDLDREAIVRARANVAHLGLRNCTMIHLEADRIDQILASRKFDLILLYAVVEHLTLGERERLLTRLWRAIDPSSYIYIGEAPNLLAPIDNHSSNLPYFHMLPLELKQKVYRQSTREVWKRRVESESTLELGFYRNGSHVSFYDFDATLMPIDTLNNHIVFDNYHVRQLGMNPLRWHETNLLAEFAGHMTDKRLDIPWRIPRCFSRYWIDFVLSKSARPSPCRTYPTVADLSSAAGQSRELDPFRQPIAMLDHDTPEAILTNHGPKSSRAIIGLLKSRSLGTLGVSSDSTSAAHLVDLDAEKVRYDYWNPNIYVECPVRVLRNGQLILRIEPEARAAVTSVLFFQ